MATYKKVYLVEKMSSKLDMTKRETERFIDILFQEIADVMREGESISIPGFGKFEGATRQATRRTSDDPDKEIPEKIYPVFRASSILKIYVEGDD